MYDLINNLQIKVEIVREVIICQMKRILRFSSFVYALLKRVENATFFKFIAERSTNAVLFYCVTRILF